MATGLIIAVIALYSLSRTQFGMDRVRTMALSWLEDRVQGEIHIGGFGGRGMLRGLTLHDFYIIDEKQRPFLSADSAVIAYNWRTFVTGRIVLDEATLYQPKIYLEQLPGDSIWNYQYVFPTPERAPGQLPARKLIMFNNARVVNGSAVVRVPFEPHESIEADDTARSIIEQVPGGLAKVMRFDSVQSVISRLIWESPIEAGKLVDIRSLSGKGFVWREPVRVTALRGTLTVKDTIFAFDVPDVRMRGSQASMVGRVIMEEGYNFFDVRVDGKRFSFTDLQWLFPDLPDEGGGSGTLRIQSQRPNGILFLATNTRIAAPGTRLAGSFGIVTGDSMYFTDVDMRAAPLNLELIEAVLPGKLPLDGFLIGTVEVKGPLSALDTKGDMHYAQTGARSGVKWKGTFDVRAGFTARNLRADVDRLDLAILTALRPDLKLRGHVSGRVEGSGNLDRSVFAANIHHYLSGYKSSFDGDGVYDVDTGLDLRLNARPLSFQELASAYPALERLRGDARGPIRLHGALDDLQVDAELETAAGLAKVNGRLQLTNGVPRYSGSATISAFQLDELIAKLPATSLSGSVAFDIAGSTAADATGRITSRLTNGRISSVDFRDAHSAMTLENGSLRVDSLSASTPLGELAAHGRISLDPDRTDTLHFTTRTDSVAYGGWGGRLLASGALINTPGMLGGTLSINAVSRSAHEYVADARFEAREGGLYFQLNDLRLGSPAAPWQLQRAAYLSVNDHGLSADSLVIERAQGGSAQLSGRLAWHGADHQSEEENVSDFVVNFEGVPFEDFARMRAPGLATHGKVSGNLHVAGNAAEPVFVGTAALQRLQLGDADLDHVQGHFTYANRQLDARLQAEEQGRRVFHAEGTIPVDLGFMPVAKRKLAEPLTFTITADSAPALLLTGFVPALQDVRGRIDGTLLAGGTTETATLGGAMRLRGGAALFAPIGVRYRDVDATLQLDANAIARVTATARADAGQARVQGTIDLNNLRDPAFDLTVDATNLLAAKRKDAEFTASGVIRLGGRYRRPEITGDIAVNEGALFLDELYRRYQIVELDDPLLYDVVDTTIVALGSFLPPSQNPFIKNLIVRNLRVDVGRESWLRSRDLNMEVTGELTIDFLDNDPLASQRSAQDLRLLGTLTAVRGTYTLASTGIARQFSIREGVVEFPGTPGVDPNLGFNAVYRARPSQGDPIDIIAVVAGSLRSPRVRLTSDEEPPISESDLASYLFFGVPTYALSPSQNAGVSDVVAGLTPFAGALTSSGFGYLANGLQTFAQNFGLVDYVSLTAAEQTGIAPQGALASLFSNTKLEVGRYFGDDVYLVYSQPLSTAGYRPGVRLEWRFMPTLTAEFFAEDRFARNPSFGIENSDLKRVWGFFLFREWSY